MTRTIRPMKAATMRWPCSKNTPPVILGSHWPYDKGLCRTAIPEFVEVTMPPAMRRNTAAAALKRPRALRGALTSMAVEDMGILYRLKGAEEVALRGRLLVEERGLVEGGLPHARADAPRLEALGGIGQEKLLEALGARLRVEPLRLVRAREHGGHAVVDARDEGVGPDGDQREAAR